MSIRTLLIATIVQLILFAASRSAARWRRRSAPRGIASTGIRHAALALLAVAAVTTIVGLLGTSTARADVLPGDTGTSTGTSVSTSTSSSATDPLSAVGNAINDVGSTVGGVINGAISAVTGSGSTSSTDTTSPAPATPTAQDALAATDPQTTVTCPDGSTAATESACPTTVTCPDGSTAATESDCPAPPTTVTCPDGSTAPSTSQCPQPASTDQSQSGDSTSQPGWCPNLGSGNSGCFNVGNGNNGTLNFGNNNQGTLNIGNNNTGTLNQGDGNQGAVNVGDGNQGTLKAGTDNNGTLNAGSNNQGTLNAGDSNQGTLNAGDSNQGTLNAGDSNQGTLNQGDSNQGTLNAGTGNSGTLNAGSNNQGTLNAGNSNQGTLNAGTGNTGTLNAGDANSGTLNAGDCNTGVANAGVGNEGVGQIGGTTCSGGGADSYYGNSSDHNSISNGKIGGSGDQSGNSPNSMQRLADQPRPQSSNTASVVASSSQPSESAGSARSGAHSTGSTITATAQPDQPSNVTSPASGNNTGTQQPVTVTPAGAVAGQAPSGVLPVTSEPNAVQPGTNVRGQTNSPVRSRPGQDKAPAPGPIGTPSVPRSVGGSHRSGVKQIQSGANTTKPGAVPLPVQNRQGVTTPRQHASSSSEPSTRSSRQWTTPTHRTTSTHGTATSRRHTPPKPAAVHHPGTGGTTGPASNPPYRGRFPPAPRSPGQRHGAGWRPPRNAGPGTCSGLRLGSNADQLRNPLGLPSGTNRRGETTFPGYIVYALCDQITGQFLKWGITTGNNPLASRYQYTNGAWRVSVPCAQYLDGRPFVMVPVRVGISRADALLIEERLRTYWGGPANCEQYGPSDRDQDRQARYLQAQAMGFQEWLRQNSATPPQRQIDQLLDQGITQWEWIGLGIDPALAQYIHPVIPGDPRGRPLHLGAGARPPAGWPAWAIIATIAILIIGAAIVTAALWGPAIIAATGAAITVAGTWIAGAGTTIAEAGAAISGTATAETAGAAAQAAAQSASAATQLLPPMT